MAQAQKPDFVFRRNGLVHLNRRGHQFIRLLAAEVCRSAIVMLNTPCSEVVWRVLFTHSIRQFPLHFLGPCVTVYHHVATGLYNPQGRGFDSRWCHWYNPSGHTVVLKSIQPLRKISTMNISWGGGEGGRCVWLKFYHLHVPIFLKFGSLNRPLNRDSFIFIECRCCLR